MSFSDEDLKRLKGLVNSGDCQAYIVPLLARLHFAENLIRVTTKVLTKPDIYTCDEVSKAEIAWRKSKGEL